MSVEDMAAILGIIFFLAAVGMVWLGYPYVAVALAFASGTYAGILNNAD